MLRLALVGRRDAYLRYQRAAARLREIELVQVSADDREKTAERPFANEVPISEPLFGDWLARHADEIDAVLFHADAFVSEADGLLAAMGGKHVLCDSPLPPDRERLKRLMDGCRAAGVCLSVGEGARHKPALQAIRSSLDGGQLGSPGLVRIHRWQPRSQLSHVTNERHSMPALFAGLAAEIDLAMWLFGRKPILVYSVGAQGATNRETSSPLGEFVQVHLGFPEGGMALIDLARTLPEGDGYYSLSLIGSAGAAYADDHHDRQLLFGGGRATAPGSDTCDWTLAARLRDFAGAVEKHRPPSPSPEEMLAALDVASAAARSLSTARPVPLTETA